MQISKDTLVTLSVEMRDCDGEVVTRPDEELIYLHGGYDEIFPKLEAALEAASVGEERTLSLDPEDAFGDYDPELLRLEPREKFPDPLEVGMQFEGVPGDGENDDHGVIYTVTDISGDQVVLDGNHPLAGERIWVRCVVREVRPATAEELSTHSTGTEGITLH